MREKIIPPENIEKITKEIKEQGEVLVTLNGSFDLLHAGHLYILEEAKKLGDILLVALNSDASIQQYKSANRPIIPLESRLKMMAALASVDYVTWFDETDPRNFLEKARPHVHANGADWKGNCIEEKTVVKHGGRVEYINLVPGLSTSNIIAKILHASDR